MSWRVGVDFGRDLHRRLPVRRGGRRRRGLEGVVHAGRPFTGHRAGRRRRHAARGAGCGRTAGCPGQLLRARHHGRNQRPHPAQGRAHGPSHHGGLPRPSRDRPSEAAGSLRPLRRQAADACVARPAARGAGADPAHGRGRDAPQRRSRPGGRPRRVRGCTPCATSSRSTSTLPTVDCRSRRSLPSQGRSRMAADPIPKQE